MSENTELTDLKNPTKDVGDGAGKDYTKGLVFKPRVDIREVEDRLLLHVDMPGVKPEDADVRFENGELQIRGKVRRAAPGQRRWLLNEYGVGDFYRVFSVTDDVDAEKISAELKHGVLTVHLPKAEAIKPRRIAVTAQ